MVFPKDISNYNVLVQKILQTSKVQQAKSFRNNTINFWMYQLRTVVFPNSLV